MGSVTFPTRLGGSGVTISDDADPDTGLLNGGHRDRFVPGLQGVVDMADYVWQYASRITGAVDAADRAEAAQRYIQNYADSSRVRLIDEYRRQSVLSANFITGDYFRDGDSVTRATTPAGVGFSHVRSSPVLIETAKGQIRSFNENTVVREFRQGMKTGLALSPQATNLALQSESWTQSEWFVRSNATVVSVDDPTCPVSSQVFSLSSSDGNDVYVAQNHSVTTGSVYTCSRFVKFSRDHNISYGFHSSDFAEFSGKFSFNGWDGVSTLSGVPEGVNAFYEFVGTAGWCRIGFTATAAKNSVTVQQSVTSTTFPDPDGYNRGTAVQLEKDGFLTPYIATSTSPTTRSADEMRTGDLSGLVSSFSVIAEIDVHRASIGGRDVGILSVVETTLASSDIVSIYMRPEGTLLGGYRVDSSVTPVFYDSLPEDGRLRAAIALQQNADGTYRIAFGYNGTVYGAGSHNSVPLSLTTIYAFLGAKFSSGAGFASNGVSAPIRFSDLLVIPRALTSIEIREVTGL